MNVFLVLGTTEEKSLRSPRMKTSLSDSRAAYQEFLLASREQQADKDTKEALFEKVERKEEKKENEEENLGVQDISLDDL